MSDQIVAALITGGCAVVAALVGLLARRLRKERTGASLAPGSEPPVFRSARAFATAANTAGRRRFIHEIELALSRGVLWLTPEQQAACAGSEWALDRIGLYLFEAAHGHARPEELMLYVRHEWERTANGAGAPPLPALRYALLALLAARGEPAMSRLLDEHALLLHEVRRFLRSPGQDAEALRALDSLLGTMRSAA